MKEKINGTQNIQTGSTEEVKSESGREKRKKIIRRIIAMVLVVLLTSNLVLSVYSRVGFSSSDYEGTSQESAAAYLESSDEYINSDLLKRNYELLKLLGDKATFDDYNYATSYAIAGNDYAAAAEYLEKAISLYEYEDETLGGLYTKLGSLYCMLDKWTMAKNAFNSARMFSPDNADVWLLSAESYLQTGNYSSALYCMEHYGTLAELTADQLLIVSSMQLELGRYEDAAQSATEALEMEDCSRSDLLRIRTQANLLLGNTEKAYEDACTLTEAGEDSSELKAVRALYLETVADYAGALALYEEMIAEGSADELVYEEAIQCAYIAGDYDAMYSISKQGTELETEGDAVNSVFIKWLGISDLLAGNYLEAKISFDEYLELDPDNYEIIYFRALCNMGTAAYEAAVADFTVCIENDNLTDECRYNRALCYVILGNYLNARRDLQKVISSNSDEELTLEAKELYIQLG